MRRRYLITYDVADDKRRSSLFALLKGVGDHAQFSVFFAELSAAELAALRAEASTVVSHAHDQVLLVDLGRADDAAAHNPLSESVESIGRSFAPPARVRVV